MTQTPKQLGQGRYNNTTNNTVYTVPASTTAQFTSIRVANTTSSAITVRIFATPSGGTSDQTTAIVYDFTIPANDYHEFIEKPIILEAAGTLVFQNGTANAGTITISGLERA